MIRKPFIFLGFIAIFVVIYLVSCNSASTKVDKEITNSKKEQIERGRYLAETAGSCMHCHSDRDFTRFAGPIDESSKGKGGVSYPRFGTLFSSNITPDSATGIGSWTDDEIARAIAFGIGKDGDTLYPIMPYYEYNKLTKEDVYSIVAYLRTLKPISNKIPERKLKSFASIERGQFHFTSWEDHPGHPKTELENGEYLTAVGACKSCHTPRTDDERFDTSAYFSGGDQMGKKFGFIVNSPNITPDPETGIGNWSENAFIEKFEQYRDSSSFLHNPGKYNTLMPWEMLSHMKKEDLRAIYTYLKAQKPIVHPVQKWPKE